MIIGIGTDIVKVSRVEHLYEKFGDKFLKKVFSDNEVEHCKKRKKFINALATRFAAKEAFLKSIKTGLRFDLKMHNIEILNNDYGAPYVRLHESAREYARNLKVKTIHVTMSDENEYATAFMVLEG